MSAWYVLSSMGFYPVNPGDAKYNIGTPLFNKVIIHLENGKNFTIEANNVSEQNMYIRSATLNGKSYTKSWFNHDVITSGGAFAFEMGPKPDFNWGTSSAGRPFTPDLPPAVSMPYIVNPDYNFLGETKIRLKSDTRGARIYYTTDRKEPDEKSRLYTRPFELKKTTTLKFKAYKKGLLPSLTVNERINKLKYEKFRDYAGISIKPGLKYKYYEGNVMFVNELMALNPVDTGIISHFSIENRKTDSYFGYEYNGFIRIPEDGAYTFYNKTNDGSILYLDGKEFINMDGGHPAHEVFRTIALKKGVYKIKQKYFQMGGGYMNLVSWKGPGFNKTEIPAPVLYHRIE
jgi:hypothetical protein